MICAQEEHGEQIRLIVGELEESWKRAGTPLQSNRYAARDVALQASVMQRHYFLLLLLLVLRRQAKPL